jgi:hypothetical protein
MYSSIDLTWPKAIEELPCSNSHMVLNIPTDGVSSGKSILLQCWTIWSVQRVGYVILN